jgi:transposase
MSTRLSDEEVKHRLVRLVNVERLHSDQKIQNTLLREQVKTLSAKVVILETENTFLKTKLTDLEYQFEQMKVIVFGKKRKTFKDEDGEPRAPVVRTTESYQRPIPTEDQVTKTITLTLKKNSYLQRTKTFFVEDIPLDQKKIVTKYMVTQERINGVWVGDIEVPTKDVVLGNNLKMLVNTLTVEQRLSYSQIQDLLKLLFNFHISQGEIANIIYQESLILRPVYEQLKLSIQAETSQHLDESSWRVGRQKDFCWSMTGGESNSSVYKLGVTRGQGNARDLLGLGLTEKLRNSVGISDDYNAYKNLFENHQLCWAHPLRKWRDLANYPEFTKVLKSQYIELKQIFYELKGSLNISKLDYFTEKLKTFSTILTTDPVPIIRLKNTFRENIPKYLTCLKFPLIQLTNNTAERSLRSLVIKRRISFGSNSQRGADALSVTFTVIKELLRTNPNDYFTAYALVRV